MKLLLGLLIGLLLAAVPFLLTWSGHMVALAGHESMMHSLAGITFLRIAGWTCLCVGGYLALTNFYLSFGRPLMLHLRQAPLEEREFISGVPMLGSVFLMISAVPLYPHIWPAVLVTALLLLDTAGPLWCVLNLAYQSLKPIPSDKLA